MSNKMFLVAFYGGPKDGQSIAVGFVPSRTLFASATADASVERRNRHCAKYELSQTRVRSDASGLPVIEVRYRFDGLQTRSRSWRLPVGRWLSNCRAKLVAWMLSPVDYPLKITHLVSNTAASETKLAG